MKERFDVNAAVFLALGGKQNKTYIGCATQTSGYIVFDGCKAMCLDEQHDIAARSVGAREAAA